MLEAIRNYNHVIVDHLNGANPLAGTRILDIGASPHGYAMEHCLRLGVREYVGIGLDIAETSSITTQYGHGSLTYMNAESLAFDDGAFDSIVTMSTFEHIGNLSGALSEFRRVLKPNGRVLASFEPVWTCSYGHHLHHFGEISNAVPAWAHLLWSKEEMYRHLSTHYPDNAPISVDEACAWIYDGDAINRKGINEIRQIIGASGMRIEWSAPMMDVERDEKQLGLAMEQTGISKEDLMTKGLSIMLIKN
jgi:ubiquinone/menaquinone biosynthesis C-methylase UbiE